MARSRRFILALDEGTSSARSVVFDAGGRAVAVAQRELAQHYPQPGLVEHDAEEIWRAQLWSAREALRRARVRPQEVAAIGIANQRETVVVWDRRTGKPIHRAIVWQDRRTADVCDRLRKRGHEREVARTTGLTLDPYFSGTKLAWLLDHVPGARSAARAGRLAAGTVDTWLLWKLTNGRVHATDPSNASRTMLMDLRRLAWSPRMLELLRVPREVLPEIVPTSGVAGTTTRTHLGAEMPVAALVGDQQASLFANGCTRPGSAKCTYGTGCFLLAHTGKRPVASRNRLVATVAWQVGRARPEYALEGSVFVGGAAIQWLRDGLGIIRTAPEVNELAASVPDSGGLVLVPAFTGLGSPHWDAQARGALLGLTRGATRAHLARATLEGIALQVCDVVNAMERDTRLRLRTLVADGGAAASDVLLAIQADLLGASVARSSQLEGTARGAAMLAGMGVGLWKSPPALQGPTRKRRTFKASMGAAARRAALGQWQRAVERALGWAVERPRTSNR
jgi:glycerol kinase